jgi:hypothetical protein
MGGESVVMQSDMTSTVPCPVCGAEPDRPCLDTRGRITTAHRGRVRRAAQPALTEPGGQSVVVARIGPADRRRVLVEELAKARAKYEQLRFAIDYLEGEISK